MDEWKCMYCGSKNQNNWDECFTCSTPKNPYHEELGDKDQIYKRIDDEATYWSIYFPPMKEIERLLLTLSEVFIQPEFFARCTAYITGINPNNKIARQRLDKLQALCDRPEKSKELENRRNSVIQNPDNPDLHYKLAISLLSSTPYYITIDKEESFFWKCKGLEREFPPPSWRFATFRFSTPYISEAKEELYFALALGLNQADKVKSELLIKYIVNEQNLTDSQKYYDRDTVKIARDNRIQRFRESSNNLRGKISLDEKNIDLRLTLVEELLKAEPVFLTGNDEDYTTGVQDYTTSLWEEARKELELIIGLGVGKQITEAKARFRLFQMYQIDRSGPTKPLLRDIVHLLKRALRDNPNNLQALYMLKTAYRNLGDLQSIDRVELNIKQVKRLEEAGFINTGQENVEATHQSTKILNAMNLEEQVQKLLSAMGLRAVTTKASGDGGIDVIAFSDSPIFSGKYIVQCKNWSNPVGEPVVRDLFGVTISEGANKGILITTGTFTNAAIRFAEGKQIELIDGESLMRLFKKFE